MALACHTTWESSCTRFSGSASNRDLLQEREEAARLFGGADAAAPAANGERTFEPGEGMAEAEAPADAPEPAPEVVEQPSVRKGPTPEQLTAIKARLSPNPTLLKP